MSGFVGQPGSTSAAAAAPAATSSPQMSTDESKNEFYFKTAARTDLVFARLDDSQSGSQRYLKDLRRLLSANASVEEKGAEIEIAIKTLTGESVATLSVKSTDTVATVKSKIEKDTGTRASKHRLLFAGKTLEDHVSIATYGVERESTLHLVPETGTGSAVVSVHSELPSLLSASLCAGGDDDVQARARVKVKFLSAIKCPYTNGVFEIEIAFPGNYPMSPPSLHFVTPIYHYAVGFQGAVCLPVLQPDQWVPTFSLVNVFTHLNSIVTDPEAMDPSAQMAQRIWLTEQFRSSKPQYLAQAEDTTIKFAAP